MLVVGARRGPRIKVLGEEVRDGLIFVTYAEVTAELIRDLQPDIVLSTLIGDHFDAIDLARRLVEANFTKRYRAITIGLPDPDLVRREVQAAAPGLDFDVFQIDGT